MKLEGSHEVEAARKRLAAAKTQGAAASESMSTAEEMMDDANETMESAKKMMESAKKTMATAKKNKAAAQSQLNSSNKEIEEAEKSLKDAETKWDVIDISESEEPEELNRKRRKSSISTTDRGGTIDSDGNDNNLATPDNQHVNAARARDTASSSYSEYPPISSSRNSINKNKIVVEGCWVPEVNGTYTLSDQKYMGSPVYYKMGRWKGSPAEFEILYSGSKWWIMATVHGQSGFCTRVVNFYWHRQSTNQWTVIGKGKLPLPRLSWW